MKTPITDKALAAFKSKVTVKGSTETDLIEATNMLVQVMAGIERAANKLADAADKLMTAKLEDEESAENELDYIWREYNQIRLAAISNAEASEPGTMTHDNPKPEAANPRRNPGSLR